MTVMRSNNGSGWGLLNAWQRKLLEFTMAHRRGITHREWKWLRYQYEMGDCDCREQAYALAADGDTLNAALAESAHKTKVARFVTEFDDVVVTITLRPQGAADPVVSVRMLTRDEKPVSGGRVIFPGIEREVITDSHGRARLDYADYRKYLRDAMGLEYALPDGVVHDLELE